MQVSGCALAVAFLCFTLEPASAQVLLSLGAVTADPGQTIALPVSITVPNAQVSGVQWTINYAPQDFTFVSVGNGAAANLASKTVRCRIATAGRLVCVASGLNSKALANGVIANLSFKAGAIGGVTSIVTSNGSVAATLTGTSMAIASASISLSIRANATALQTLSCPTKTLTLAAPSSVCTLTLSNPAPAGGLTVSLGTVLTGIAALTVAKSAVVPAGAKTVTFPAAITASAIGTASAILTATANAVSRSWTFSITGAVVTVGLTPRAITLYPAQKTQFQASVSGIQNTAVTYSLSPNTGVISSSGLYTAPAQITAATQVTLTAASVADPSKKITAIISLAPPVTIAVAPTAFTLAAGQSMTFKATVGGGAQNKTVVWSLSPGLGTISVAGVYIAPAQVPAQTKVTLTATSVADGTKKAVASVTLIPQIVISVTPGAATVSRSRTQQFTATLTGTANTGVTWSVLPAGAGAVSSTGLYTAPAAIPSAPVVMVVATSAADKTRQARAMITVQ